MDISKVWKLRNFEKKFIKTLLANDAVEFIRAEGLIPRPSGAKPGVLNPTAIPYENTIPRCSAAGLVIVSTKNQYTQLTDKKKARKFLETAKEKIEGLLSGLDKL